MKRIFSDFAYSDAPRAACWWDQTAPTGDRPRLEGDIRIDVAIIGGGFTGLSAALHLAQAGVGVCVVESHHVGWGASGRNGGFCCLGGGMLKDKALQKRFGDAGQVEWIRAERAAIDLVDALTTEHGIDVDRQSDGETELAHRPQDMDDLRAKSKRMQEHSDIRTTLIEKEALADHGMNGPFHGGLTVHAGFGLNPRKYVNGLAEAAEAAGATIFHDTTVDALSRQGGQWRLRSTHGTITADKAIIATNGYSAEDVPKWLAGRFMPAQSSVIVTRPLTRVEIAAQGWSSDQMGYDTRNLLHYFRLMPDRRFLFGMRGGLLSSPSAEARALGRVRRDFDAMFPAWQHVDTPFGWSGMVCIARNLMPFVGPVPDHPGVFAGMCYHGNGVAMASYAGALLADLVRGTEPSRPYPAAMQSPLRRFGLGPARRLVMPPMYLLKALADK